MIKMSRLTHKIGVTGSLSIALLFSAAISAAPIPFDTLQPGEWYEAPASNMSTVDPCPANNCNYSGATAQLSEMSAWSGGAYDSTRDRLIVWGGGHADYGGNEIYAFGPLTSASPAWQRVTEPSSAQPNVTHYADGKPSSRHTYNYLVYDIARDSLFSMTGGGTFGSPGAFSNEVDSFSFTSGAWRSNWPNTTGANSISAIAAYDPILNVTWYHGTFSSPLTKFDPAGNGGAGSLTVYPTYIYLNYYAAPAIDTKRHKMLAIGGYGGARQFYLWDLNNPNAAPTSPSTSGASGGVALESSASPGFAYDPIGDRYVAWNGGTTVYTLNPDTWVWTQVNAAATNTVAANKLAANSNGTYGRFRYIPSKNAFVVVNNTNTNVFVYKLTAGGAPQAPSMTLTSSVASVVYGGSATLTWSSTNSTSCTASGAWSGVKAVSGSETLSNLSATGSYTLTCSGAGGSAVQSTTITVTGVPAPTVTLSASVASVAYNASTTLTWSSTNATACTASGAWSGTKASSGSESTGALITTATYVLTCTGSGGSANQSTTVTVAPAPPSITLSASPATVSSGGTSVLNWSTTNATACTASGVWSGTKGIAGSESTVALTATSTFTLTCTGGGGSSSQSATVAVSGAIPAPTVTLSANPTLVATNGASTLMWSSTNANNCTASGAWSGTKPTSGSEVTSNLTVASTYILACSGAGGSGSASITVSVGQSIGLTAITTVKLINTSAVTQAPVLSTFGHYFRVGDVPTGYTVIAKDSSGNIVPLQVDKKATHADGSLRHAILTTKLPSLAGSSSQILSLFAQPDSPAGAAVALKDLLATGFDAVVALNNVTWNSTNGGNFSASAKDLLSATTPKLWLSGPLVSEWIVGGPVKNGTTPHDHLTAYFHVRAYAGSPITNVRVDTVVENNWTYKAGSTSFSYLPTVSVGGSTIYSNSGATLTQYHHTRWHQVGWWGNASQVFVQQDTRYLRDSKAVPNYASLTPTATVLNSYTQTIVPMDIANLRNDWSGTGYSPQIGLMPEWYASFVMSGDIRAFNGVLTNDSAGGAFSYHYRDDNTGIVPSIDTYPTLSEQYPFPETPLVAGAGGNPNAHDIAHEPLIGYLSYLLTGDYYYLEELQFLANWGMLWQNYVYRQYEKGVFASQNRGQAWGIRTLAAAAAITPDSSALKAYFTSKLYTNVDDRAIKWSLPPTNNLGAIQDYAWNPPTSYYYSPWQNHFFVATFNWVAELGFNSTNALSMRNWLNKWPTGLMGQDNSGYCAYYAGEYDFTVGIVDAQNNYRTFLSLYQAQHPVESALPCPTSGLMLNGYPAEATGYYSNMQPALAMAVDAGQASIATWNKFVSMGTPDYTSAPTWAIVPRPAGNSAPNVTLSASPSSVTSGGSSTLSWVASNATGCTAAWTTAQASSGSQAIMNITGTTTYTMTCTGAGGSSTQSVTVSVVAPVPTVTLSASATSVAYNGSSTLSWTSTNATSCTASGAWSGGKSIAASASQLLSNLTTTGAYALTCANASGSSTPQAVTITVGAAPLPTVTLSAAPTSIAYNGSTTLNWTSTNATSCTAGGMWSGAKAVSGSQSTGALASTATYSITCVGAGGTSLLKSVTITVAAPPASVPVVTITASPLAVSSGGSTTLTWSSTNATSCAASGGWTGTKAIAGSEARTGLTATSTFTITCSGSGGSGSQSVTVNVTPPPVPTAVISVNPPSINYNGSTVLSWSSTDATKCVGSGGWSGDQAVSGSTTFSNLKSNTTYSVSCSGPGGSSAPQQVAVAVAAAGLPKVSLSATQTTTGGALTSTTGTNSLTVSSNDSVTMIWSSVDADTCTASASVTNGYESWTGVQATGGSQVVGPLTESGSLTLECVGPAGKDQQTVAVTVAVPGSSTASGTKKVGGGVFDPLLAGGLLLLWGAACRSRTLRVRDHGQSNRCL